MVSPGDAGGGPAPGYGRPQLCGVGLLCVVFVAASVGGCAAGGPVFQEPEQLVEAFVKSIRRWRIKDAIQCLHPSLRGHVSRTFDMYVTDAEQRDVLFGHLRRSFGDSIRTEDYVSLEGADKAFGDYNRVDLASLGAAGIDRKSPKVAYLRLGVPWSLFPHRAELEGDSWWLRPAPEDIDDYLRGLKVSRKLLQLRTEYYRDLSAGIRDGRINETNIQEHLERVWY